MLLALSIATAALLTQDKGGPAATDKAPTTVDRSAEPALKEFFAKSGALRNVHLSIEFYSYETEAKRYDDDSSMNLWIGDGGRLRMLTSSNTWGGGSLFVSDGGSLLSDDLSDDGTIRLSAPKKTLHEINDQEILLYVLEGQAGLDVLADKDQPIKFVSQSDGGQEIELHNKKLGKIVLTYRPGCPIPCEIATFTAPWWSDDAGTVSDHAYTVERVRLVSQGPIASSLFVVAAPKGKKVTDERTPKK